MLSTVNSKGDVHAWPMTTSEASIGGKEIWFIGDKTSDVVKDIQNNQKIGLSYASKDEKTMSLSAPMLSYQRIKTN
ncbi:hypothetical protein PKHYL_03340 [Psychrobacter sp. KH172YL61]|nr:pyridoxamine 5'-phosphate oxidase family protein [Psychrobacter sp. KH172YL61]BBI66143.1 hypothetical protein PKHYL_03340 [Psychrobacter sp. KH172YL61]